MRDVIQSLSIWKFKKHKESIVRMWVLLTFKIGHVNIQEAKRRYAFRLYLHYYYSCISLFQRKPVTKKVCKTNRGWHYYDKRLEIYKGSEKFVLAIFYSNVD